MFLTPGIICSIETLVSTDKVSAWSADHVPSLLDSGSTGCHSRARFAMVFVVCI